MINTALDVSGNEIERALSRNGVRRGSPLEDHIRAHAYDILLGWYANDAGVANNGASSDLRMDAYISAQRSTAAYADSFIAPVSAKKRVPISDQAGLLALDIREILQDRIEVYDDRQEQAR